MAFLKKINPNWEPIENPSLKVGEVLEFHADPRRLVESGAAILVDEEGIEQPLPGQVLPCPVCYRRTDSLASFLAHVDTHRAKVAAPVANSAAQILSQQVADQLNAVTPGVATAKTEEQAPLTKQEETKQKRIAALAKAREIRAAKLAAANA